MILLSQKNEMRQTQLRFIMVTIKMNYGFFLYWYFLSKWHMELKTAGAKKASLFNPFIQCWLLSSSISLNREACHTRGDLEVR